MPVLVLAAIGLMLTFAGSMLASIATLTTKRRLASLLRGQIEYRQAPTTTKALQTLKPGEMVDYGLANEPFLRAMWEPSRPVGWGLVLVVFGTAMQAVALFI